MRSPMEERRLHPPIGHSRYGGSRHEKLDPWRTGNWSQGEKDGSQCCVMVRNMAFRVGVRRRAWTLHASMILTS